MPSEARLPTGTVTMLFTDIEGSTRLLRGLGEGYPDALAEHQRLLREAWAEHDGSEVGTQGDSFFVAFSRASDAVAAAVQGQRLLSAHAWPGETPLRVRMGIHTGEPDITDRDYVGIDVHRAARIAAAGHGGQILLSRATVDLLPEGLDDGIGVRALGMYSLKDLAEPELLFQLVIPGLEHDFPELNSARPGRSNLPVTSTPLVGRDREVAEIRSLLERDDVRLLTLTGPGGTGKTRLALEVAAVAEGEHADGAFLVTLTPIIDPGLVLSAIAQVLPLPGRPTEPLGEWLSAQLQGREMLIVLDNFEQVTGAASAVGELLARTEGLKVIVTSREPLRVAAEHEYPVQPLELPDASSTDPAVVSQCASVAFFLDRAMAVRPDFRLTTANAAAVAAICRRLDGLPLAIELAVPWLRMLEPQALRDELDQRLDLLADSVRGLPERQRTVRGAIDWSYRLLKEDERTLFAQLGIFSGGWTLEAAAAVCAPTDRGPAMLVVLGSLVDKNLVVRDTGPAGSGRFGMLGTIRSFARERLEERKDRAAVARRHAEVYLSLVERAEPELYGPEQAPRMRELTSDLDNLRAAMSWAIDASDGAEVGLRFTGALMLFWFFLGQYREGLELSEAMLERSEGAAEAALAKGLLTAGQLAVLVGDHARAQRRLEEGLTLGRRLADRSSAARCLNWLGLLAFFRDEVTEARRLLEESVAEARAAGDLWCLADALGTLGSILPLQGDFPAAEAAAIEALEIAHRADDQQGVRMALFGRALSAVRIGDLANARSMAREGLAICRSIGDAWFISYFLWLLAMVAVDTGETEAARRYAEESLVIGRRIEGQLLVVCALEALAAAMRAGGDADGAAATLEEALHLADLGGVPTSYTAAVVEALGEIAAERGDLGSASRLFERSVQNARAVDDRWGTARALVGWSRATRTSDPAAADVLLAQALTLHVELGTRLGAADALEVCARVASDRGEARHAATLLATADGLLEAAGAVRPDARRRQYEETAAAVRARLGDEHVAVDTSQTGSWKRIARDALTELRAAGPG